MALTNKQVEGVINLFVTCFINSCSDEERKRIFVEFEDAFGKSVGDWQSICREKLLNSTLNKNIVDTFNSILNRKEKTTEDKYEIRTLRENDLDQVTELIRVAFGIMLRPNEYEQLKNVVKSGFSVVACIEDEIIGVILAYEVPDYVCKTIYIDTFAVAESLIEQGIGRKMLKYMQNLAKKEEIYRIKLQTDPRISAYKIYKHWGFQDDQLVHMHKYFL